MRRPWGRRIIYLIEIQLLRRLVTSRRLLEKKYIEELRKQHILANILREFLALFCELALNTRNENAITHWVPSVRRRQRIPVNKVAFVVTAILIADSVFRFRIFAQSAIYYTENFGVHTTVPRADALQHHSIQSNKVVTLQLIGRCNAAQAALL